MNETKVPKKFHQKPRVRITAGILVAALLLSLGANAAVGIRIQPGDQTKAATNYLVDHTKYVIEGRLKRLQEKVRALQEPTKVEDYYRLAGTQIAQEDYTGALSSMEQCLSIYSGGDDALYLDLLMKRGCLLVLLGQDDEALQALDQALEQDQEQADAYLVKAQIYAQREETEPLALALEAYLELKPEDSQIRALLAQAMFTAEDYKGATEQYQEILNTAPPDADLTETAYLYGLTSIQLGNFSTAEKSLKQALAKDNTLEGIYYYIGVCQMSRGDYAGAVSNMTASIQQNSLLQLSHYTRGVCRLMTEDYDYEVAVEDLQKAADYKGTDADQTVTQQAKDFLAELATAQEEADRLAAEEAERLAAEKAAAAERAASQESSDSGSEQSAGQPQQPGENAAESNGTASVQGEELQEPAGDQS
ncbi:MAG: tetratricopeptide repeat protein [Lawsonibacter sp.]|nr:tetratricopeptide repeat protein [Lawsonibacter sp.]